uniref:Uncharacterized protein n=1 Tax=Physcomitrium patens TaxID=3218 RepID=A0A2K1JCI5_PHYPA|nr:hypothetical protein PHYPA_019511 [Physcomitrium patens]
MGQLFQPVECFMEATNHIRFWSFNLNNHQHVMGWRPEGSSVKFQVLFAAWELSSSSMGDCHCFAFGE